MVRVLEAFHKRTGPEEQIREAVVQNYFLFVVAYSGLYEAVSKNFGEEGRKVIGDAWEKMGLLYGEVMTNIAEPAGQDATSIARSFVDSMNYFGYEAALVESSPKKATVRVTHCVLLEYWRRNFPDILPGVCDIEPRVDLGSYKYINPTATLKIPKRMSAGDPFCEYVIEIDALDPMAPQT